MIDATLVTACVLCAGLLARLILTVHRDNTRLRHRLTRTVALCRRVRRERDEFREDFKSAIETCCEMQRELDGRDAVMSERRVLS